MKIEIEATEREEISLEGEFLSSTAVKIGVMERHHE